MIIFNHHFLFTDEVGLQDNNPAEGLEKIVVSEQRISSRADTFPLKTAWCSLSGRDARFHSTKDFSEAGKTMSWALEIKNVLTLIWDSKKRRILYVKGKGYSTGKLCFWMFHSFFPMILDMEQKYHILHAGAIEINHRAILFVAPSFGGKSTMVDFFISQGHRMISDDTMGIDRRDSGYFAVPSYPFHRPFRKFEVLGDPVDQFSIQPKPLQAVYLLVKGSRDIQIRITELKGIDKFTSFHFSSFIGFTHMKKERFVFFTEMAQHIPVYSVTVPWSLDRRGEVYASIVDHSGTMSLLFN